MFIKIVNDPACSDPSAAGTFIFYDGFTCGSAEEIQSVFSDIAVNVTEVTPEK